MSSAPARLAWLDHARAVGIVLVVLGHAIRSVDRTGLTTPAVLSVADGAIYSFHMPLFFVLAGMTQTIAAGRGAGRALAGLFWGIVLPYLLWSAVWFLLKSLFAGSANQAVEASLVSILWQPVDHFWFLYVLAILRLVWIGVEATGSGALRRLAVLVPLAAAFVGWGPAEGIFNPFLLFWAAFYGVGVLVGGAVGRIGRSRLALGALAALATWAAIVSSVPDLLTAGFGPARTLAGLAGSWMVIAGVAALAPGGLLSRAVGLVGEASLAIFLTHTLFGAAMRVVLAKTGLLTAETLLLAATVAGILGPLVLYLGVLRLGAATRLPLARWLGLGTQRKSHWLPGATGSHSAVIPGGRAP